MKYCSTIISRCILCFVVLLCIKPARAQNIFNSNGTVKSPQQYYGDKAAEAAAAKRNADEYARAKRESDAATRRNSPASNGPAKKLPLTDAEKAAQKREWEESIKKNEADKQAAAAEKAKSIQKSASYNSKIGKYQEVTSTTGMGSIMRVKLNDKYGFVNDWGDELVPLIYDFASDYFDAGITLVRSGKKWGYIGFRGAVAIPIQYDDAKDFSNHKATVKLGKFWGLIDLQGKLLLPFKYDEPIIFNANVELAPVSLAGKYGCVNINQDVVIPMIYEGMKTPSYGLIGAKLNGKWGFIDKKGDVKISFQFDDIISGFVVSSAVVVKGNAKFRINTGGAAVGSKTNIVTGENIVEVLATGTFTDKRENKVYNSIKIGDQVWMAQNLDAVKFGFGLEIPEANSKKEWDKANKDQKAAWCYYDNNPANGEKYGKLYNWYAASDSRRIAPEGWHIPSQEEWTKMINYLGGKEFAGISMKNAAWSYETSPSNPSGFAAVPAGFRWVDKDMTFGSATYSTAWWARSNDPANGYSFVLTGDVLKDNGWTVGGQGLSIRCIQDETVPVVTTTSTITSGNNTTEVKPAEYIGADYSLRMLKVKNKFGYVDESGNMVIQPLYDDASFFYDGLAAVSTGKKYGFIDMKGNMVIAPAYYLATSFSKGHAMVMDRNKGIITQGFIDKTGELVIPMIYEDVAWQGFYEDCVGVMLNGKWGFVDGKNNIIVPLIYEKAEDFHEGLAAVQLDGKWGFIDKTGKVILPIKYEHADSFNKGVASVTIEGATKHIDKNGKEVVVAH